MADYCIISILGAMDRLWFHQIILSSEPTAAATLMLSNNLKIPEESITPVSTYPTCDALLEDTSPAKSEDDFNQDDDGKEDQKKEITRSNSSSPSDQTRPKTMMRLQKTMSCKTLAELELEEVKGFMDLGFKFTKENLSPITMSVVPGLQRIGRLRRDRAQDEAQLDDDEIYEEDDDDLEDNDREVMRPYLSEAWVVKEPDSPLLNLKLPRAYGTADMKQHLRYWARTVASIIRQES